METNNIDNIIHSLGVPISTPVNVSATESAAPSPFSESDISDILEQNGVSEQLVEESDEEDSIEEDDDTASDISQESSSLMADESSESSEMQIPDNARLPLNSPTLLVNESTTRFSGAEWFSEIQKARVIIAGVGGIGSNVAFQLARMVPANITLYDDDVVEAVNMAGQLYGTDDIGKNKVDAIADMISSYTSMRQVNAIPAKFTSSTESGDIMVCGFDNMRARRVFFDSWIHHVASKEEGKRAGCLLIDGRLSMDTLQVLCIRGDDDCNIERYQREFLFSDSEADRTVCSMKQTTYLACMIGSLIVNLLTNFIAESLNPIIPYDVPFFIEYDAQHVMFKTEH